MTAVNAHAANQRQRGPTGLQAREAAAATTQHDAPLLDAMEKGAPLEGRPRAATRPAPPDLGACVAALGQAGAGLARVDCVHAGWTLLAGASAAAGTYVAATAGGWAVGYCLGGITCLPSNLLDDTACDVRAKQAAAWGALVIGRAVACLVGLTVARRAHAMGAACCNC